MICLYKIDEKKTDDFLNQLVERVNRYRKNEEMNSLLHELNLLTKINRE